MLLDLGGCFALLKKILHRNFREHREILPQGVLANWSFKTAFLAAVFK